MFSLEQSQEQAQEYVSSMEHGNTNFGGRKEGKGLIDNI